MNRPPFLPKTHAAAFWWGRNHRTTDTAAIREHVESIRTEAVSACQYATDLWAVNRDTDAQAIEEGVRSGKLLAARMEDRIAALGEQPSRVAAAMVAEMALLLEEYGDDALEGGR